MIRSLSTNSLMIRSSFCKFTVLLPSFSKFFFAPSLPDKEAAPHHCLSFKAGVLNSFRPGGHKSPPMMSHGPDRLTGFKRVPWLNNRD